MHELETIATFLNVAAQKILGAIVATTKRVPAIGSAAAGRRSRETTETTYASDLDWATGYRVSIDIPGAGTTSQETQLLGIGTYPYTAIWIANNDDADTDIQKALVDAFGITTPIALFAAAQRLAPRVLDYDLAGNLRTSSTAKMKLLHLLLGDKSKIGPAMTLTSTAANPTQKIPQDGKHLATTARTGLTFVTKNYEGRGTSPHAEQKLLAVLGDALRADKDMTGNFRVAGIKSPCTACAKILADVKRRLSIRPGFNLDYETNTDIAGKREAVGLDVKSAGGGIRELEVAFYFPWDPPATAAAVAEPREEKKTPAKTTTT